MKKLIFPLLFLLLLNFGFGEILVSANEYVELKSGSVKEIEVKVKNLQERDDWFALSVWPQKIGGIRIIYPTRIFINAGSEEKILLHFITEKCVETTSTSFELTIYSLTNEELKESRRINVFVGGLAGICISSFNLNKFEFGLNEELKASLTLRNFVRSYAKLILRFEIENSELMKLSEEKIELPPLSYKERVFSVKIGKDYAPGIYKAKVYLKDLEENVIDFREFDFEVLKVKKVRRWEETKINPFFQTITIFRLNEGNEIESIEEELKFPKLMEFFISAKGNFEKSYVDNNFIIEWEKKLLPGEIAKFEYKVELWKLWLLTLFSIFIIILFYQRYFSVRIEKIKEIKPMREILISLSLKNTKPYSLMDVKVEDFVPSMFELVKGTRIFKPKAKKVKGGIKLVWNIEELKPGEERVLAYRIKPLIEFVGRFKLPKAVLFYREKGRYKKLLMSKTISLESFKS